MKLTVHGSGYVGAVSAACFASMGNNVVCVDIDEERVAQFNAGVVPLYEPGLAEHVNAGLARGNLRFVTEPEIGVAHGDMQFIAVGTPPARDGSADISQVLAVAEKVARYMESPRLVITKSTVPVGTGERIHEVMTKTLATRGNSIDFDVISNPEFLKEGSAVEDFMRPDRIIVGVDDEESAQVLRQLYAPFTRNRDRFIVMPVRDAEFTKYAANAMLASRISVMNEFAQLAERLHVNIENVRQGIGADPRIGFKFIYPGCGYGGSCFPKDVNALLQEAKSLEAELKILSAVASVNAAQKRILVDKLIAHYGGKLADLKVALWGLAFKPNTDDMREAPSRVIVDMLIENGATVQAYDPGAMHEARRIFAATPEVVLCDSADQALDDASALIIATEWAEFRSPDFAAMLEKMRQPVICDGRNLYDPALVEKAGFAYYSIGRPPAGQAKR